MRTHAQILIALLLTAGGVGQAADATADAPSEQVKNADLSELYTIGKDTTWVTGDVPRTRDGRVDYAEWLRQHYSKGITRDNNAAVLIVKALGPAIFDREVRAESLERLGFEELPDTPGWVEWDDFIARKQAAAGASPDLEEVAGKQFKRAMAGPWAAEDCPLVSAWLERNDRAMDQLVEASARSHLYFPYVPADDPPTVIGTRIPSLSSLREASEALVARAMLQAREGGLDVAWADLFAVSRLSRLLSRDRSLIVHMVSFAMAATGARGQGILLQSVDAGPRQRGQSLAELQSLPRRQDVVSTVDIEHRLSCLDAVMTVMRAANSVPEVKARPEAFNWDRMLRTFNEASDLTVRDLRATDPQAKAKALRQREALFKWMKEYRIKDSSHGGDILNESGKALGIMLLPAEQRRNAMTDRVTASLLSILFPALNRVTDLARAAESHDDLASIVAALESFKGKEGRYPAELGELVESGLLKKLPCDPFSKDAAVSYVYKPTGDGYLLYSRDEDRDDDGGTEGRTNRDGDIVFSRPAPKSETPDD